VVLETSRSYFADSCADLRVWPLVFCVLLLAASACLRGWSGCRSKGAAERVLRGKTKLSSDGRTGGFLSGGEANGTVLLKFDQGSLHFDIHIGRKLLADLIGGKGARLDVFVPPSLEGQFQISAKLATHTRLRFYLFFRCRGYGTFLPDKPPPNAKTEPDLPGFRRSQNPCYRTPEQNTALVRCIRPPAGCPICWFVNGNFFLEGNRGCVDSSFELEMDLEETHLAQLNQTH